MNSECSSARPTQKLPGHTLEVDARVELSAAAGRRRRSSACRARPSGAQSANSGCFRRPASRPTSGCRRSRTSLGLPGSALGSGSVRSTRIGCSGHGSSSSSGISQAFSGSLSPWLNQSWTSNWIHAPASRFRVVAGSKLSRVSNSRLIRRGFGSTASGSSSGHVCSSGTLRPNRLPIEPINGSSRSL